MSAEPDPAGIHGILAAAGRFTVLLKAVEAAGLVDMLEAEDLREIRKAAEVDSGPAEVGRGRNVHVDIRCPVDGARMVHMVDPVQQHIEFEACPRCHGAFFDAGEYADLTRRTVLDWFRTARARRDRLR